MEFQKELESLINKYSKENESNTPDFILAKYIILCLNTWNDCVTSRENWYGRGNKMITNVIKESK